MYLQPPSAIYDKGHPLADAQMVTESVALVSITQNIDCDTYLLYWDYYVLLCIYATCIYVVGIINLKFDK